MKQRLLVMNGQRLLQSDREGQWATSRVEKAVGIKPGIYNLYLASAADKTKSYDGVVLHADRDLVYQQVGRAVITHDLARFTTAPEAGGTFRIQYLDDKAVVLGSSAKQGRGRSR